MFKKINAFLAALTITATAAGMLPANAENNYSAPSANEQQSLPSKVDLSVDDAVFLSEVGDQGSTNSCVAFTTTYYQFTYEIRKAYYDKYGVVPAFTFSPKFIYNRINNGVDEGTRLTKAYELIKELGAVTSNDVPFLTKDPYGNYKFDCTDQKATPEQLCKALTMKLKDYNPIRANGDDDAKIRAIKEQLNAGKIVATTAYFNDDYGLDIRASANSDSGECEKIIVQNLHLINGDKMSHAFTVVGYDDDLEYFCNGKKYKGAFKIVNSWNEKWGNEGFIWVAYDSLRKDSQLGLNYDKTIYERVPGLGGESFNTNVVGYTIDVDINDIRLTAEADINTQKLSDIKLNVYENSAPENNKIIYNFSDNNITNYEGSVVGDIDSICGDDYFCGKTYTIEIKHYALWLPAKTTVNYVALRDDLGQVVAKAEVAEGAESASVELNLQRGDIDYDGELTYADATMIREYVNTVSNHRRTSTRFSTLQRDLMDVNRDNKITPEDADIIEDQVDALNWAADGTYIGTDEVTNLEWNDIKGFWYFLDVNGRKVVNQFIYDARWNGSFFVDEKGRCIMNSTFTHDGKTYYADENGVATEV